MYLKQKQKDIDCFNLIRKNGMIDKCSYLNNIDTKLHQNAAEGNIA